MIKRFASHFIFLPGHGYLKQYVVGVEEGQVVSAFSLTEEIEGVEWFPGVIALLNNEEDISEGYSGIFQKANEVLQELPEILLPRNVSFRNKCLSTLSFRFYNDAACRRNSAQTTAVAIATFSDSDVSLSAG